jgi:hypothetical protein
MGNMGKKVHKDTEMEIDSERIKKKVTNIIYNTDNSLHSELQKSGVLVGKYYIYTVRTTDIPAPTKPPSKTGIFVVENLLQRYGGGCG